MRTTEEFDCAPFQKYKDDKVIRGLFDCSGKDEDADKGSTTASSTAKSSASPTGAASPLDLNLSLVMGSSSLVATILQLFL